MPPFFTILRIACLAQIAFAGFLCVRFTVYLFSEAEVSTYVQLVSFIMAVWLAIFTMQLLHKNYPDIPVARRQKTVFNWLFIINFFLLSFHFAYIIGDIRALVRFSDELKIPVRKFPPGMFMSAILYGIVALLQVIILYGLFRLRRTLYYNFCRELSDIEHH
ncbi:MAG: hypothetical protein KF862_08565 [Chitinophagaceae bacterium]|nr:hypothetical protein [Chitinophagaceae bacterium]